MGDPTESDLVRTVRALAEHERSTRDALIDARERLVDRDEMFAALETQLWSDFEAHERDNAARIADLEQVVSDTQRQLETSQAEVIRLAAANAELQDRLLRVELRLARLLHSRPVRLMRRATELPLVNLLATRRARGYERDLERRLRS